MIIETYESRKLQKEDLTFIIIPYDDTLSEYNPIRDGKEPDVHDSERSAQLHRYKSMRDDWRDVFSRNIVYIENDPTGKRNSISTTSFLMSLLMRKILQDGEFAWGGKINTVYFPPSVFGKVERPMTESLRYDLDLYKKQLIHYMDIPLIYCSGDVGIVNTSTYDTTEFICVQELSKKVSSPQPIN